MLMVEIVAHAEIARDFLVNISAGFAGALLIRAKDGTFDAEFIIWSVMEIGIVYVCYRLSVHLNTKIYEWRRVA